MSDNYLNTSNVFPIVKPVEKLNLLIDEAVEDLNSPEYSLKKSFAALLSRIKQKPLLELCVELGWKGSGEKPLPQKKIKVAIVHALLEGNSDDLMFDAGELYVFTGSFWQALKPKAIETLLRDSAIKLGCSELEAREADFIKKMVEQLITQCPEKPVTALQDTILNFKNCSLVINSEGMKQKVFDRKDYCTHQLPIDYEPKSVNPIFLKFLEEVLPDLDTRRTLQQAIGYLFTKNLKLEKIPLLQGSGANGKSVIFETMKGLLGDLMTTFALEELTSQNSYCRPLIKDALLNFGSDISLTKIDHAIFKTLASGEPITARQIYGKPFTIKNYAKSIFSTNVISNLTPEHTHGFFRRLILIPFEQTVPLEQQDKELPLKILADKSGVLNWILEGTQQVLANKCIYESGECKKFMAQFKFESDSVAQFEQEIVLNSGDMTNALFTVKKPENYHYSEQVSSSHDRYTKYCKEAGYKPIGRSNFSKRMQQLGFKVLVKSTANFLEKQY